MDRKVIEQFGDYIEDDTICEAIHHQMILIEIDILSNNNFI